MANTKSAKKSIRVHERNRVRNVRFKSRMRSVIKKAIGSITSLNETRTNDVQNACQVIDKTAAKGVVKQKTASRLKSRLMKSCYASQGKVAPVEEKPAAKKTLKKAVKKTVKKAAKKTKA